MLNNYSINPHNWLIVFFSIAIFTLLSIIYGWLVKKEKLPFNSVMAFNRVQWQFMKVWVKLALLLGIILPLAILIVFWHESEITPPYNDGACSDRWSILRQFFSCYLLVIVVQLASEIGLSRVLCKSVVVILGTLYTGFRIWQLWAGLHLVTYSQPWLSLLWLVWLFWVANMIMLITMAIPSIFPKSDGYSFSSEKSDLFQ